MLNTMVELLRLHPASHFGRRARATPGASSVRL